MPPTAPTDQLRRPPHMALGEPLGPYILTERLGMGGLAEVYRAHRPMLDDRTTRPVAIKRLHRHLCADPVALRHLLDEALITLRLQHPHIAQTYAIERDGPDHFLVMELVDGPSLSAVLGALADQGRSLPLHAALRIAHDAADALAYAHTLRDDHGLPLHLIHLDLSPDNLLLSSLGHLKLIDFGLARAASQLSASASAHTRGRARYLSPERALGLPFDHRADLFSLGLILWQLLTNQHPLAGLDPLQAIAALQRWSPPPLTPWRGAWPPQLIALLETLLAARPQDRTPDAATLRDVLARLLHDLPAPSTHPLLAATLSALHLRQPFPPLCAPSAARPDTSPDAPTLPTLSTPALPRRMLPYALTAAAGALLGWLLSAP